MSREIRFLNTAGRKVKRFEPLESGHARIYTCGPTVYNFPHIGNYRTFLFEDVLRRTLKAFGYRVTQVMNLTDIDDKTINGAAAEGISLREFTDRYVAAFFEDIDTLGVERAEHYPRATEWIPQMVELVQRLTKRGHTYVQDGSTYFPHRVVSGLRQALGHRCGPGPGGRPGGCRRVREGGRARLRPVEGAQGGRTVLGRPSRSGPAGLAP
jgi:cysteinyl-tRNA synthetase